MGYLHPARLNMPRKDHAFKLHCTQDLLEAIHLCFCHDHCLGLVPKVKSCREAMKPLQCHSWVDSVLNTALYNAGVKRIFLKAL